MLAMHAQRSSLARLAPVRRLRESFRVSSSRVVTIGA